MRKFQKVALALLLGTLVSLASAEVFLRVISADMNYAVLPENRRWEFHPVEGSMPGISGVSVYSTNEVGIRGDRYQSEDRYNILAIGGSTTQCKYLDDLEAWPHLLQDLLNQAVPETPVWVGNIGRSGHGLVEHIHHLRYFVPQFRIDLAILMVGVNDLLPVLHDPEAYSAASEDPRDFDRFIDHSFVRRPFSDSGLGRCLPFSLAVWNAFEILRFKIWERIQANTTQSDDRAGLSYIRRREQLRGAPHLIAVLPDLSAALYQYERNLLSLIESGRSQQIRLVLVTQPALWHENLSDSAARLLWLGYYGEEARPSGRYAPKALAAGLALFNERLLGVCRAQELLCFDLAARLSGNETYFYDDVHFNEPGAARVAELLFDFLRSADVLPCANAAE